ncbi:MAG: hypothetical protein WAU11_16270 [Ignavibacteriaceae bacterium]
MQEGLPLFKEYRLDILQRCLVCFDENNFDREKQRNCVLKNYDMSNRIDIQHWDKSVFRGMVIPSLKYLGLLYGNKDELMPSANGKLLIAAHKAVNNNPNILRTIVFDLDKREFNFLDHIRKGRLTKEDLFIFVSQKINIEKKKPLVERINKWLSILAQVKLVEINKQIQGIEENIVGTENDFNVNNFNKDIFIELLLESYKELSRGNVGIIKIEDLKKLVLIKHINIQQNILISSVFDELFSMIELSNENYLISLGKPMGAKEMLLLYKNNYYDTIHIKFLK